MGTSKIATKLRRFGTEALGDFPWLLEISDWEGNQYSLGQGQSHWHGDPLKIQFHTPAAGREVLDFNGLGFLERFLAGEIDLSGNLFLLDALHRNLKIRTRLFQVLAKLLKNKAFQNMKRAKLSIKSHYDIPQEALNVYLDKVYMSYSCGMFDTPRHINPQELLRVGQGASDDFDSLEKAQWRKFKDAVDFIGPREGETLLDVGCGYGGQLAVALENHPFGKAVGWTHSRNQVEFGSRLLQNFDGDRYELNEGDYRQDHRAFDHITSTGMISHVGPRGLIPYVREIRRRIRKGGRYVHHAIMRTASKIPLDFYLGPAFNKKYVWPGFHWFPLGKHIRALEQNGFEIARLSNLSPSYHKTTAAWYERMMAQQEVMKRHLGEATFRAWQIYLAGASGALGNQGLHVYRVYCVAV